MEYYNVYTTCTAIRPGVRDISTNGQRRMSYAEVVKVISELQKVTGVMPTWTIFKNAKGRTIEKVMFQQEQDGIRWTDVFWVDRGYRYR